MYCSITFCKPFNTFMPSVHCSPVGYPAHSVLPVPYGNIEMAEDCLNILREPLMLWSYNRLHPRVAAERLKCRGETI